MKQPVKKYLYIGDSGPIKFSCTIRFHKEIILRKIYFHENLKFAFLLIFLANVKYRVVEKKHVFEMGSSRENFFLWAYLKSKVYVRKPRAVDDLKVSIREEIATVPQEMLIIVMQNFEERIRTCVQQEGRHLSDIIFRN